MSCSEQRFNMGNSQPTSPTISKNSDCSNSRSLPAVEDSHGFGISRVPLKAYKLAGSVQSLVGRKTKVKNKCMARPESWLPSLVAKGSTSSALSESRASPREQDADPTHGQEPGSLTLSSRASRPGCNVEIGLARATSQAPSRVDRIRLSNSNPSTRTETDTNEMVRDGAPIELARAQLNSSLKSQVKNTNGAQKAACSQSACKQLSTGCAREQSGPSRSRINKPEVDEMRDEGLAGDQVKSDSKAGQAVALTNPPRATSERPASQPSADALTKKDAKVTSAPPIPASLKRSSSTNTFWPRRMRQLCGSIAMATPEPEAAPGRITHYVGRCEQQSYLGRDQLQRVRDWLESQPVVSHEVSKNA